MSAKQKSIFLSHSSKDKVLADKVADLLTSGCAVNPNDILCTTLEGKGIPAGTPSFIEYLRQQIQEPKLVILLLSENFFASQFCLCELGAVWGMGLKSVPLVVPPVDKGKLKATLAVTQAGEVNSPAYLDELRDLVMHTVGASVPTPTWNVKRDAFLQGLAEVLKALPELTNVPAEKLKEAQEKYQAALKEIGAKEKEAVVLKQQIADLEKCKDKDEGNAVARKYSSTQEQFEKLVQGAKGTLEKVKQITAAALFAEQAGHPCFPGDGEWPEAMNALEIQEIKRDVDRVYPRLEHIRVSRAQAALQELDEFLKAEVNAEFLFKLEQDLEFPPNIANKEFWHRYLRYV